MKFGWIKVEVVVCLVSVLKLFGLVIVIVRVLSSFWFWFNMFCVWD